MKASDLTGPALDWAVAKCDMELVDDGGQVHVVNGWVVVYDDGQVEPWSPSTNWAQGGPLLDFHMLTVGPAENEGYEAYSYPKEHSPAYWGETPLEAAMRCIVAAAVGDEIEVPTNLKSM